MQQKFKRVPFNLEYLKANPKTGIVNEDGLIFVEYYIWESRENWITLLDERGFNWLYKHEDKVTYKPLIGDKQLFLMVPCKIEVMYINIYRNIFDDLSTDNFFPLLISAINEVNKTEQKPLHVYKFTFEDSILVSTEIAHTY